MHFSSLGNRCLSLDKTRIPARCSYSRSIKPSDLSGSRNLCHTQRASPSLLIQCSTASTKNIIKQWNHPLAGQANHHAANSGAFVPWNFHKHGTQAKTYTVTHTHELTQTPGFGKRSVHTVASVPSSV